MRRNGLFSRRLAALLLSVSAAITPFAGSMFAVIPACAEESVSYSINDEFMVFILAQAREQLAAQEGVDAASKVVELSFDRNINLSLSDVMTLCSEIPAYKKCLFAYEGEKYVMEIPMFDTGSTEYAQAKEALSKEPGKRADFREVARIFKDLGVAVSKL